MKEKNTLPIKWMLVILLLLTAAAYWTNRQTPIKDQERLRTAPGLHPLNKFGRSSSKTGLSNQIVSHTSANPINPTRTDSEILQSIAQQNENRERIASLLAANTSITAQIRQLVNVNKYQTVTSQSIPGPDTTPPPADIVAKLKSNQLIHH